MKSERRWTLALEMTASEYRKRGHSRCFGRRSSCVVEGTARTRKRGRKVWKRFSLLTCTEWQGYKSNWHYRTQAPIRSRWPLWLSDVRGVDHLRRYGIAVFAVSCFSQIETTMKALHISRTRSIAWRFGRFIISRHQKKTGPVGGREVAGPAHQCDVFSCFARNWVTADCLLSLEKYKSTIRWPSSFVS